MEKCPWQNYIKTKDSRKWSEIAFFLWCHIEQAWNWNDKLEILSHRWTFQKYYDPQLTTYSCFQQSHTSAVLILLMSCSFERKNSFSPPVCAMLYRILGTSMNTKRWLSFTLHREDWLLLHSQHVKVKCHEPKREGKESRTKHTQDCYVQSQMSRWVDRIQSSGKWMIWRGAKLSTESGDVIT